MDEIIENRRESSRNLLKLSRRNVRDEETDHRRDLGSPTMSDSTTSDIAKKLTTKSAMKVEELRILKNCLLQDGKYVEMLSTHGALRGLVRELSGSNTEKQSEAAGCCCNLALGDERSCMVIAKAAGSYLVTSLDSLSPELAVNCSWAIGNLAASGLKVCQVLCAQGALAKLLQVLVNNTNEEVIDSVLYAVGHFVYNLKDELRHDHLEILAGLLLKQEVKLSTSHIIFLLSCHKDFLTLQTVNKDFLERIVKTIIVSSNDFSNTESDLNHVKFTVRILANICVSAEVCESVLVSFVQNSVCMKEMFSNDCLRSSLLWLTGNVLKFSRDSELKEEFVNRLGLC